MEMLQGIAGSMVEQLRALADTLPDDSAVTAKIEQHQAEAESGRMHEVQKTLGKPYWWTLDKFEASYWPEGLADARELAKDDQNGLFAGDTGSGKSWLARGVAVERAKAGVTVYRISEPVLRQSWEDRFNDFQGWRETLRQMGTVGCLVIDELGKNRLTEDSEGTYLTPFGNVVFSIFDTRYENGLQTITTTQHGKPEELQALVGKSMFRRVVRQIGKQMNCRVAVRAGKN
jgi:DNA replication protein DnaC